MEFYPEGCCEKLGKTFASIDEIKNAMIKNEIIEGKVLLCDREHNIHIDLGVIRGIIKREEGAIGIDDGTVRDIALISKVGKSICFNIIGFERDVFGNTFAVLSRKSVQEKCKKEFLDNLKNGDVIDAKVTHLEKFGAFIDIGAGINSLIPIDMLSVSRISHPKQRLTEGQKIKVALRKREGDKLTFTLKELLGSWEENADLFTPGETVTGVIRSIEDYGVFVELMPNLAGLAEIDDNLFEGQSVAVYIKSIIKQKMKIKLIIVEAYEQENTAKDLVYFNQSNHINYWQYSPKDCPKIIKTDFNE